MENAWYKKVEHNQVIWSLCFSVTLTPPWLNQIVGNQEIGPSPSTSSTRGLYMYKMAAWAELQVWFSMGGWGIGVWGVSGSIPGGPFGGVQGQIQGGQLGGA